MNLIIVIFKTSSGDPTPSYYSMDDAYDGKLAEDMRAPVFVLGHDNKVTGIPTDASPTQIGTRKKKKGLTSFIYQILISFSIPYSKIVAKPWNTHTHGSTNDSCQKGCNIISP